MKKLEAILYDVAIKIIDSFGVHRMRKHTVRNAYGHVLEIGSGTGINFPIYTRSVDKVDAIEPNRAMIKKSTSRKNAALVPIQLHQNYAECLPFPDHTFDTIVCTLVFCTIKDPLLALYEIQRVAKPGATILFMEHVKMQQPLMTKIQNLLTPVWKRMVGGCHLNRDTLTTINRSGLDIREVTRMYKGLFITVACVNNKINTV